MADIEMDALVETKNHKSPSIAPSVTFTGLSKDELLKIEKEEKIWKKIRIILFVLFWITWIGMLIAAIIIIILTPKCPPRPNLNPWEKSCIYRVNPYSFKDSNQDNVGDIAGLKEQLDYIVGTFKSKTIIIDQFLKGTSGPKYRNMVSNFKEVDPALGTTDEFIKFVKYANKQGIQIVVTIDFNGVSTEHPLVSSNPDYFINFDKIKQVNSIGRNGKASRCKYNGKYFYSSLGSVDGNCVYVDLDLTNNDTLAIVEDALNFWLKEVGVGGILFTNAAYFVENFDEIKPSQPADKSNAFFESDLSGKAFSPESVNFINRIRSSVFDPINSVASKKKVLMVEAGDIGVGTSLGKIDKILNFVTEKGAADVVLVSEFNYRRGFKGEKASNIDTELSLKNYAAVLSSYSRSVGVSMANPYTLKHSSLEALIGTFLTPGLSIIQMGTELNLEMSGSLKQRLEKFDKSLPTESTVFDLFPKSARSLSYRYSYNNENDKDIFNDAMLPWDLEMFSNNSLYQEIFATKDNIKLHNAVGAPQSYFSLIKTLSGIRNHESLLWGEMKWILEPKTDSDYRRLIFQRSAIGHPAFIVVYIATKNKEIGGEAFSFADVCEEAKLLISFPKSNSFEKEVVDVSNIYVDTSSGEAFYLFQCT